MEANANSGAAIPTAAREALENRRTLGPKTGPQGPVTGKHRRDEVDDGYSEEDGVDELDTQTQRLSVTQRQVIDVRANVRGLRADVEACNEGIERFKATSSQFDMGLFSSIGNTVVEIAQNVPHLKQAVISLKEIVQVEKQRNAEWVVQQARNRED